MWTREELKTRGKAAFLRNYWICVVAALILTLLVGSGTSNSGNSNNGNQHNTSSISGFTISSDNLNVASFAERFTPLGPVKFVFRWYCASYHRTCIYSHRHFYPGSLRSRRRKVFHRKLNGKSGTWLYAVWIPEWRLRKNSLDSVFDEALHFPLVAASYYSWNCKIL